MVFTMAYNKNNALVKVENNSLKEIGKRAVPKIADGAKRIGKIAGWGSLAFLGVGAMAIGNAPVAIARRNGSIRNRCKNNSKYII